MFKIFAAILFIFGSFSNSFIDSTQLMESYIFSNKEKDFQTDALLIIKNGKVVYEKYAKGYQSESRHFAWSVSKAVTGTLIGVALQRGDLSLNDRLSDVLKGYDDIFRDDVKKRDITVEHVINWASSLNYIEEYEQAESFTDSSVLQQLYGKKASKDMTRYLLSHDMVSTAGGSWRYTTGDTTLLTSVLRDTYSQNQDNYPWDLLFDELGMQNVTWERDASGNFVGGSHLFISARDLAKVGSLYLNDGEYNGKRLLPEGYVEYSTSLNSVYLNNLSKAPDSLFDGLQSPGRQWWLNRKFKSPEEPVFDNAPVDTFMAIGHWGQFLAVVPSEDLIVVRFGEDRKGKIDRNTMFGLIFNYLKSEGL